MLRTWLSRSVVEAACGEPFGYTLAIATVGRPWPPSTETPVEPTTPGVAATAASAFLNVARSDGCLI